MTGIIGCASDYTQPSGTLPVPVADGKDCVEPTNIPVATSPPGTDAAGSTLPTVTVTKPDVSMPAGQPPTELKKIDIVVGDGAEAKEGDIIDVDFIGVSCSSGKQFLSTYDEGQPMTAPLTPPGPENQGGGFPQGMVDGIKGMKVGGRRQLIIPPALAYGDHPLNEAMLPGETIVMVIDLRKVETPPATTTTAAPATTVTPSENPATTAVPTSSTTAAP